MATVTVRPAMFPPEFRAPGTGGATFLPMLPVEELPEGEMRRVTVGDLDLLLVHPPTGILAIDDRCPHMSAPLSIGKLDDCVLFCPLHNGRFDLESGGVVQMPTTGGLDPVGVSHPTWSPPGAESKPEPPGKKAEARRLTRVRWLRYYPVRIVAGQIEVAIPEV